MTTQSMARVDAEAATEVSWMPMVVIALAQILMVFNVSSLQVSIDGIATSFNASATSIGTAIVTYSLVVAGFIMLGARMGEMYGARRVFRATVLLFGAAMALVAASPNAATMIIAQVLAGAAAAALVPTLVVLVAEHYRGNQQATALGWLGGAAPMGIVLAFLIAGVLTTLVGWRFTFGALVALAAVIFKLSDRLTAVGHPTHVKIDAVGIALVALAVILVSIGANNIRQWGLLLATPQAPFDLVDMSPAPIMIVGGVFLAQGFFAWSRRRVAAGEQPLISLAIVETPHERSALFCVFIISALTSAITFLIPLYLQVVQGRSSIDTAMAVIPFSLGSFAAAVLIVRAFDRLSARRIARISFMAVAVGIALLAVAIRNDWSDGMVIGSMILIGLGEGALITLLFNVLVSAAPKALAGDVGSLRGTTNNLAAGVGTAIAGALVTGLLSTLVHRELADNTAIPLELRTTVDLSNVKFVSNDQLRRTLESSTATAEQVAEAERINTEARLLTLKVTFFTLAGISLLAFFPAGRLPAYARGEIGGKNDSANLEAR